MLVTRVTAGDSGRGNVQVNTNNVVVLYLDYVPSPADRRSPEAQTTGTGEAWVFSAGKLTGYVNGVKGSEQNLGGVLQDSGPAPDRVMIGATRSGTVSSFNWKGWIDEVAIYDHALTAAQIRAHYRAVAAAPPSLTIENAVVISWPIFPPGYVLQSAGAAEGPYLDYGRSIFIEGDHYVAPVPIGPRQRFFRLFRP